jgi:uncharacterized lipoprotein YmbA
MRVTYAVALLAVFLLLMACRSDPVHYHTLTPLFSGNPRLPQPGNDLQIERVVVPPQVDRSQIVIRQNASELILLETDWWGASLAEEVQSALTLALGSRPDSDTKMTLRITVLRFDLVPGHYALLDARWRIRSGQVGSQNMKELVCQSVFQTPSGVAVDDLVLAQQASLRNLAAALSEAGRSAASRCP